MPGSRYMEEIGSAAMLAAKRSAGVTPEVNLKECVKCMPPPSADKAAHFGFETQRRHHQKSKNRGISGPTKRTHVLQILFFKKMFIGCEWSHQQECPLETRFASGKVCETQGQTQDSPQEGAPTLQEGTSTYDFTKNFQKKCTKLRKFWGGGACAGSVPLRSVTEIPCLFTEMARELLVVNYWIKRPCL